MGCTNCGSGGSSGGSCGGSCGTGGGGCVTGKLDVVDWLANMHLPTGQKQYELVEVRFKNGRKNLYRNTKDLTLYAGDTLVLEATSGYDVGVVSLTGELVKIQQEKKFPGSSANDFPKIHRIATQEDIDKWKEGQKKESVLMYESRKMATELKMEMKISDVEYQGDLTKATFYYTAEGRVDFRQLIKTMADRFKVKIEMRQIGARQEAARLGGISSSGRELCCSTWITDFRTVSTSAARYQQLSLNPQKLAGQCGKLKCCLNYELDMYLEGLKSFPNTNIKLKVEGGEATHIKTDIFKKLMWYAVSGSGSLVGLSPDKVKEIIALNKKGEIIKDIKEYEEEITTSSSTRAIVPETLGFSGLEDDNFNRLAKQLTSKPNKNKQRHSSKNKPSSNREGERPSNKVQTATSVSTPIEQSKSKNNPNIPSSNLPKQEGEKREGGNNSNKRRRPNHKRRNNNHSKRESNDSNQAN